MLVTETANLKGSWFIPECIVKVWFIMKQYGGSECAIVQLRYAYLLQLMWFMKSHGFGVHEF